MAIREGKWKCPSCSTVNRGAETQCGQCGTTRDANVKFFLDENAEEVTEASQLAKAKAGADWLCEFCGNSSSQTSPTCTGCGAPKSEKQKKHGDVIPIGGAALAAQPVAQPGPNSLACLSCHDGQVAVDSVINMPGSGGYNGSQSGVQNNAFLNAWTNTRGPDATIHIGMNPNFSQGCLACHAAGAGIVGAGATDFSIFIVGTDLRNDHPVGVRYPAADSGLDFKPTTGTKPGMKWFDTDSDSRPDAREVRLYDSGNGFMVECASCHDPHGVPSGGPNSAFNPSFLRMGNTASALCLTCHTK